MKLNLKDIYTRLSVPVPDSLPDYVITSFLTDSRSLIKAEGTLFFAIPTSTNSGERYIPELLDAGVRYFIVPDSFNPDKRISEYFPDACFIKVPDPVGALQKLSTPPSDFHGEIIAVTGSRGKTVLKEWLYQILEPIVPTIRSPRSFNSRIGVPLSMTEITPQTEVAIIEAGVSSAGEMIHLRETVMPDTVIITNLGEEHSEGFIDMEQKAREKVSLADTGLPCTLIFCDDDPLLSIEARKILKPGHHRLVAWSFSHLPENVDFPLHLIAFEDFSHSKGALDYIVSPSIHGRVEFYARSAADMQNAAHALAYMLQAGYSHEQIAHGFRRLHPIATRLSVSDGSNGCSIIYDSFTSDVSSLSPALDFMMRRKIPCQEPVVIMSDMRHEVEGDDRFTRIADLLELRGVRRFVGIGEDFMAHKDLFNPESSFFPDTDTFIKSISVDDFRDNIILIKGAPEFGFGRILEILESRTHETVLEVNLDALVRNFNYFRSRIPTSTGMIAMVKASGYGAGSYEIAKTLQDAGAAYLAVAVLDEGLDLRKRGITMPIMVMNPRVANYRLMFSNNLEPEIYTFSMLEDVIEAARRNGISDYPIHIKLDTGMHRMGFMESEIPALMDRIKGSPEVRIATVFSHLATADCMDMDDYTNRQFDLFSRTTDFMLSQSRHPFKRHILNSAGIIRFPQYHYDFVRLGIGLYGVNTLPDNIEKPLELVSTLKTVIISISDREPGDTIGYGRNGKIQRPSRIATIPVGYADGMNRHFGNGAIKVLVNGYEAPTIGNICMDACMIDVTGIECGEGDTVVIFGPEYGISRLSDLLGTIPYEILTSVSPRVKRIYFRE